MTRANGRRAVATRSASDRADGRVKAFARRASRTGAAVLTAALVVLALGAAAGRWQVLPAQSVGDHVSFEAGSLVIVEPIDARLLDAGDEIYVQLDGADGGFRNVVSIVDSWERKIELNGRNGERHIVEMPPKAWRVSRVIPYAGIPLGILVGPIQSIALVVFGLGLIVSAEWKRSRAERNIDLDRALPAASPVTHDTPVTTG